MVGESLEVVVVSSGGWCWVVVGGVGGGWIILHSFLSAGDVLKEMCALLEFQRRSMTIASMLTLNWMQSGDQTILDMVWSPDLV